MLYARHTHTILRPRSENKAKDNKIGRVSEDLLQIYYYVSVSELLCHLNGYVPLYYYRSIFISHHYHLNIFILCQVPHTQILRCVNEEILIIKIVYTLDFFYGLHLILKIANKMFILY